MFMECSDEFISYPLGLNKFIAAKVYNSEL
jgi:hypothetical protein